MPVAPDGVEPSSERYECSVLTVELWSRKVKCSQLNNAKKALAVYKKTARTASIGDCFTL